MDSVATGTERQHYRTRRSLHLRPLTEWKLLVDARPNNIRVDNKPVCHIVQGEKNGVGEQELKDISTLSHKV